MKIECGRPGDAAFRRLPGHAAVAVAGLVLVALGTEPAAGQSRSRPSESRRSRPPAGAWDKVTAETFLPDAFSTLDGPRPSFQPSPVGPPADGATNSPAAAVRWSALVSPDTLTDEVKDAKASLDDVCRNAGTFKGGGFDAARASFGALAVAFGVIDAYDGDVRWKKNAAVARDLFARAGLTCVAGTDDAYAEAKARLEDLAAMFDGRAPAATADRSADFRWSEAASRPTLMVRLEQAFDAMRPTVASAADFERKRGDLLHAAEIVAVLGEIIQQPDFADHDDDTYRGYSSAMRDAAGAARAACERKDYDAARAAVGRIEKACADCHGDYRG